MYPIDSAFRQRAKALLPSQSEDFLRALDAPCPPSLRVNTLKTSADVLLPALGAKFDRVPWCKDGFYYPPDFAAGKSVLHEAGAFYIQEASAMFPVSVADIAPGQFVLDLCAAPGGKTTQIAAAMKGKGVLIANEVVPSRASVLSRNVERMGVANAVVLNESVPKLQAKFCSCFDRVLVDAPCSGEGMFARSDDARREWTERAPSDCAARQRAILASAKTMVKAGGMLVYSTCTFAPEENELQIADFLAHSPDFELVDIVTAIPQPELAPDIADAARGTVRIMPHLADGNGHFCAVLRKTDGDDIAPPRIRASVPKTLNAAWQDFRNSCLKNCSVQANAVFGDTLLALPDGCPDLSGLKTLRAGLRLGDAIKNRFVPSHSLAAALSPDNAASVLDLPHDGKDAHDYLFGATIDAACKGWTLVCASGCSLGWGKGSDGVVKNHYPKGLRPTRSH